MRTDADLGGGTPRSPVEVSQPAAADVSAGLYACVVCGENTPRYGSTCERCKRNLEEDRLERESGR